MVCVGNSLNVGFAHTLQANKNKQDYYTYILLLAFPS
jgi:hypothetical protein